MDKSQGASDFAQHFIPDKAKSTLELIERDQDDIFELPLLEKIQLTHDTFRFIFTLPGEDQVMGLPVGGHVFFHIADAEGELISRKYTPTSQVNERGIVAFLIKLYLPNDEFPEGGLMSKHLH